MIEELLTEFDPCGMLASWWELRERPNVLFVRFDDLLADLEGEARRIASFRGEAVTEAQWPDVVDRCTIGRMRETGRSSAGLDFVFAGGADSFFHRGTNGRWRGKLTDAQLDRLDAACASLPAEAADWLAHGSLALGWRP